MTVEEQARRDRYKLAKVQRQFAITRSVLRHLLSQYLGVEPLGIVITVDEYGKPQLNHALQFNVSHTDSLAVIAVSWCEVGVDVECLREMPTASDLVRRYFSPEEQQEYSALPDALKLRAFFRGWTHKEAILKGLGIGTRNLNAAIVRLNPGLPAKIIGPDSTQQAWQLAEWQPDPKTLAAIAVKTTEPLVIQGF